MRYEVGVCITTGEIVWISGPFRCGINNLTMSCEGELLKSALEEGETVEADCGYEDKKWFIKTPNVFPTCTNKKEEVKSQA